MEKELLPERGRLLEAERLEHPLTEERLPALAHRPLSGEASDADTGVGVAEASAGLERQRNRLQRRHVPLEGVVPSAVVLIGTVVDAGSHRDELADRDPSRGLRFRQRE